MHRASGTSDPPGPEPVSADSDSRLTRAEICDEEIGPDGKLTPAEPEAPAGPLTEPTVSVTLSYTRSALPTSPTRAVDVVVCELSWTR